MMVFNETIKLISIGIAVVLVSALRFFYPNSKAEQVSEEVIERIIQAETGVDIEKIIEEEESDQ